MKTNIIFFDRREDGLGTSNVWFYELTNDGFELKQTRRPIDGDQLPDFLQKSSEKVSSSNSWSVPFDEIAKRDFDLSAKNPNKDTSSETLPADKLVQSVRTTHDRLVELVGELDETASDEFENIEGRDVVLADVCSIESTLVDPREPAYAGLLHVGGANIESGTGALTELKTATDEGLKSGKFLFSPDDVLYNKIRPYLRKVARPDFAGLCSADMYPLRPKAEIIEKDYLYFLLLSKPFTDYAKSVSNRAGMPKVNRKDLFAFRFQLPATDVQRVIVERLNNATASVRALEEEAKALQRLAAQLAHAMVNQAFDGA